MLRLARYNRFQSKGGQYRWQQWVSLQWTPCILHPLLTEGRWWKFTQPASLGCTVPMVTEADGRSAFLRAIPLKSTGPDGVPACPQDLCRSTGRGFHKLLPISFQGTHLLLNTIIILVPNKSKVVCLNDYPLVDLTSTTMKCFKRAQGAH